MLYEKLLNRYRMSASKVLEIGVAQGYSLRMWNRFFKAECEVKGIDIAEAELCDESLDVTYGDSKDASLWTDWNDFDIIIDDGDHTLNGQMRTAEVWLPKIKDTGIYIIEDLHNIHPEQLKPVMLKTNKIEWTVDLFDMRELKNRNDDVMIVITKDGVRL